MRIIASSHHLVRNSHLAERGISLRRCSFADPKFASSYVDWRHENRPNLNQDLNLELELGSWASPHPILLADLFSTSPTRV